ncbi:sigma-54-dependent transcriptional regulator, partial [Aporhodopirellula aestuarii]
VLVDGYVLLLSQVSMSDRNFQELPRILIIDDQWGSGRASGKQNELRRAQCKWFGLVDETGDHDGKVTTVSDPVARATFCRGQLPQCSRVGDVVKNDIEGALETVRQGWECEPRDRWACVFVDMEFPTGEVTKVSSQDEPGAPVGCDRDRQPETYFGLELIRAIRSRFPDIPVVILSSKEKDKGKIDELYSQLGVKEFLPKSANKEKFRQCIFDLGLIPDEMGCIAGRSLSLHKALKMARLVGQSRANVMILGETGTGKELLAEYVMRWSRPSIAGPQIRTSCANFSENLAQSELFGHRKGAFTDAKTDRVGVIEAANQGDLFLDELGALPPTVQSKLLRVMESRQLVPFGGEEGKPIDIDVRFIAATNENLRAMVDNAEFRHDLLPRFNVVTLELPPLRERMEDLPVIVNLLINQLDRNRETPRRISSDLIEHLQTYDWPDNIRGLKNAIERAIVLAPRADRLTPDDIPLPQRKTQASAPQSPTKRPATDSTQPDQQPAADVATQPSQTIAPATVDSLIDHIESFQFDGRPRAELDGKWPKLQDAFARLIARYFEAALIANPKTTYNDNDERTIEPNVAESYRLVTGEDVPRNNKTKARRLFEWPLKFSEEAAQEFYTEETELGKSVAKKPANSKS